MKDKKVIEVSLENALPICNNKEDVFPFLKASTLTFDMEYEKKKYRVTSIIISSEIIDEF